MMIKKIVLFLFACCLIASCKKTYQCKCSNSNGTYDAGEVEGTKSQAKKHCENLSSGSTTCGLK